MENEKVIYKIINKKIENEDTFTLSLQLDNGEIPEFIAGQYINIFFDELDTNEGKAYSISSAPREKRFDLTIKIIGKFSNKLNELKIGDEVKGTLPYGFFYSEENNDLILIAGGIGVTPFRSIIFQNTDKNITLFHSARFEEDLIFKNDFESISNENFNYIKNISSKDGRFNFEKLELKDFQDKEFMICGSIYFVRDIWKILVNKGIKQENIYTEAFFSN